MPDVDACGAIMRVPFATRIEPYLTANGLEVLRARYLRKNDRDATRCVENLDAKVQDVLDEYFRQHDARLMEELERRLHEHHLIAAGQQEVINALAKPLTSSLRPEGDSARHESRVRCR